MRITPLKIENQSQTKKLLRNLGVSRQGIRILSPKSVPLAFKIEGISSWEANIIKQHLLSLGTDSALNREALTKRVKTATLLFGNISQLRKLCVKLQKQPFGLKEISRQIALCIDNLSKERFEFEARGKTLKIKGPLICGIVNITPDSFSGDGLLNRMQATSCKLQDLALKKAEAMVKEGAKIIDLGGESTRPFSRVVSENEEIRRIIPSLKRIRKEFKNILVSVDTYKYKVAKEAAEAGADIINDITALRGSLRLASLIRKYKMGVVLMHMKGRPEDMQINPKYRDVVQDIMDFFKERLSFCRECGIEENQILIDPGIGFGKSVKDNFTILRRLYEFKIFGLPIFVGLSRKSFIGKTLKVEVDKRLTGTIAANVIALSKGANILRVHDVKETSQAMRIMSEILNN